MAVAQQIASQNELPDEKVVGSYIGVHKLLEPLFFDVNNAEVNRMRQGQYLQVIFDELSTIAIRYLTKAVWDTLLKDWNAIEAEYGPLASKRRLLSIEEWGKRKRALIGMREVLGMGTTAPSQAKNLGTPLRMAEFHRTCGKNCPRAKALKESHRRFQ